MANGRTGGDVAAPLAWTAATAADEPLSVRDGKVAKKRSGLSRFYPSKAQSFSCISELVCPFGDDDAVAQSALQLSKSMSARGVPPSRALQRIASHHSSESARLRRVNTLSFMVDTTSSTAALADAGVCSDADGEAALCSALDGAHLRPTAPATPALGSSSGSATVA